MKFLINIYISVILIFWIKNKFFEIIIKIYDIYIFMNLYVLKYKIWIF